MRPSGKKILAVAAGVVTLGVAGTAAFAYWTSSGSGGGSGTAASSDGTSVTLHGTIAPGLYPGSSVAVSFTADNSSTTQTAHVGTVHASAISASGGCDASAFHLADVAENASVAAGASGASLPNGGTLSMDNTNAPQDNCKGATITLTLSS